MSLEKLIEDTVKAVGKSASDAAVQSERLWILGLLSRGQDLPNALAAARRRPQNSALDGIILVLALYAAGEPKEALKIMDRVATQFKRFMLENPFARIVHDAAARASVENRSA